MVGTALLGASSVSACIFNERCEGRSSARRPKRRTDGCRFRTATFICVSYLCMPVHTNAPSICCLIIVKLFIAVCKGSFVNEEESKAVAEVVVRVHRVIRRSINGHNEED